MKKCNNIVFFVVISLCGFVLGDITLIGVKCGQKVCSRGEYCSPYHTACESCSKICEKLSHNYDANRCVEDCQDYIHDILYVSKNEGGNGENGDLRATVQMLSHRLNVVLILVCFILIVLAVVLCIQLYRWMKKKNITVTTVKNKFFPKKNETPQNKNSIPGNQPEKPDLRLEIHSPSTQSEHSPVTVTTSISRRPAEDSTLDYAYDNPAMNTSPTINKTNENSF